MTSYKTFITVDDPSHLILSNLPFQKGQRVRIVILAEDEKTSISQRFRNLFKETQSLSGVNEITEEEIAAEIAAYRQGE